MRKTLAELEADLVAAGPDNLPPDIQKELPVAAAAAQRNLARLETSPYKESVAQLQNQLVQTMGPGTPKANRLIRLRFIASQWSKTLSSVGACKTGCAHCCHISVAVPRKEAELIAKATGARLDKNANTFGAADSSGRTDFKGTPCVFLEEGACSIYEHRPTTCRTLVSMADDDTLCHLREDVAVPVPYANSVRLQASLVLATQGDPWADVREWFPQGLGRSK